MDTGDVMAVPQDAEASFEPLVDNTITDTPDDYIASLQLSQDNTNNLVSTTNAISQNTAPLTPKRAPLVDKTVTVSPKQMNLVQFAELETDYADGYDINGEKLPFFYAIDLEGGARF